MSLILLSSVAGFFFYRYRQQRIINQKEIEILESKKEKQRLQIAAIANSLNPHFINNSLNWLQWSLEDNPDAIKVVSKLAENIKSVFQKSKDGKAYHSLKEEMTLVKNYISIQQIRYGNYFEISFPDEALLNKFQKVNVPLMQLQIHIENAIEHGLRNRKEAKIIEIKIVEVKEFLQLSITDDGVGRAAARNIKSQGTGSGTGMLNDIHTIFNSQNSNPIKTWYIDNPFINAQRDWIWYNGIHINTQRLSL